MNVSVVIPTFNRGYIIGDALRSVLAQSYRDFDVLVVDDSSTDNTREIVEKFGGDKTQYLRHDHNRGCSAAYNTGIRAATGNLIAFLDSDDIWKPDYLDCHVSFLTRHPEIDLVFCDTEVPNGSPSSRLMSYMRAFPKLLRDNPTAMEHVFSGREMFLCLLKEVPLKPTAVVVRREALVRSGLFDEAGISGTDWDLFLRLSQVVAYFGYTDRALATQRRTSDGTHQIWREQDKLFLLAVFLKQKAVAALKGDGEALAAVNVGLCSHYNSLAWTYLESGRGRAALSTYLRGFKETFQPKLFRKFISALIRLGVNGAIKAEKTLMGFASGGGRA
jgi:glycosyltransferase involved in cell wall biosynthesis